MTTLDVPQIEPIIRSMKQEKPVKPYTASTLAKKAGVSKSYVARLCRRDKLPALKVGGAWLILREVGDEWIENRERRQQEEEQA